VRVLLLLIFSIYEVVRPADANKIANLAQHPKRLGTAGIEDDNTIFYIALKMIISKRHE